MDLCRRVSHWEANLALHQMICWLHRCWSLRSKTWRTRSWSLKIIWGLWVPKDASRKRIEWRSKRVKETGGCWGTCSRLTWMLSTPATRLNVKTWGEMPCFRNVMGSRHFGTNVKVGWCKTSSVVILLDIDSCCFEQSWDFCRLLFAFSGVYDPPFLLGFFFVLLALPDFLFPLQHWSHSEVFGSLMARFSGKDWYSPG